MILVRGTARGTTLTGRLYLPREEPPSYDGAPEVEASYVWVCDEFYEVESGGFEQTVGEEEVNVAFEPPSPRGYSNADEAISDAKEHVTTQFLRIGVSEEEVEVEVIEDSEAGEE
ncbi:MAG: hypothetical protein SV760_03875 [Halobacteria archaeon]|nr:hypothetical protein [Halobacteria archaeon]